MQTIYEKARKLAAREEAESILRSLRACGFCNAHCPTLSVGWVTWPMGPRGYST